MHACNVSPVAFLAGEPRISASGSIMRFRSGSIGPLSRFRGTPSPSIGCCVFRIDVCYRKLGTECGQTRSRKNGENNSNRVGTHERRWMALLAISAFWQLCGSFTAPAAVDFGTEHQHRSLSLVGQAQVAGSTLPHWRGLPAPHRLQHSAFEPSGQQVCGLGPGKRRRCVGPQTFVVAQR